MTEVLAPDSHRIATATLSKILCVDDEQNILSSLRRLFRPLGYEMFLVTSAAEGLLVLETQPIDLIISDMRMPQMDGAEFLKQVAQRWPNTVRILLTGYSDLQSTVSAINQGHIYRYVSKPWEDNDLKLAVQHALATKFLTEEQVRLQALTESQNRELEVLNASLEGKVKARTAELEQMMDMLELAHEDLKKSYTASIRVFAKLVDMREGIVAGHTLRVADLARKIAVHMGMDEPSQRDVLFAGLLHDLGKLGWHEQLIGKAFNSLTAEERQKVMTHPVVGQAVLMSLEHLHGVAHLIRHHHERFDGKGYPDGLVGDAIPLGARILSVANDFDALQIGTLVNQRLSKAEARQFILEDGGVRYDPRVVSAFLAVIGTVDSGHERSSVVVHGKDLMVGMELAEDLVATDNVLLLSKDHALDENLITKIQEVEAALGCRLNIRVYTSEVAGSRGS